ncbi:acyltransferase [Streptococcus oralis]|uniref:acyltransferase family protein n=1 Tax=Streptococcus oralis TaxID=1303 RepID=UPI0009797D98|nr:acyltransferase family protein [Streptococcus oralis]AQA08495.1 acyltransferase family protein [Streptococcus oralis]MBN6012452.1 acyltransferase [Streptococcus oralis subsp. oralis]MCP9038645.1 acyltransferase [Streptococcus oralis]MCP9053753.1 acyltransferase [Streptococcus oralis]MCP9059200.1 acyltransferase [Streptococcus oralis]
MRIKWFSLIRITGLLLVLLYHFFQTIFPGGFFGVDVFFTFSGFLITSLLLEEFGKARQIDLLGFFKRRFYRIVPPVVLMVLVTMPFTFLVRQDYVAGIGGQVAGVLGFMTNFYEMLTGGSYESQFIPHLFVHNWSLAVEVHYYILWGLAVWFLSKRSKSSSQLRGMVFLLSAGAFIISFFSMFIGSLMASSYSSVYFSSLTHVYPFFLGSILATVVGVRQTSDLVKQFDRMWDLRQNLLVFIAGLLVLVLLTFFVKFTYLFAYLFGFLLASLAAVAMIFAARVLHEKTPEIQEPRIITFLADTSYAVYLFHWPFYIIFSQLMSNLPAVILTIIFSYFFAILSFYIVEPLIAGKSNPLIRKISRLPHIKPISAAGAGILTLIALIIIAVAPQVGAFETGLMVNGFKQAQTNIGQTKTLAEQAELSRLGISEGTSLIGDSVALRANTALQEALPEANINAQVSRTTKQANDIMLNNSQNKALLKTVVIATGVNNPEGYKNDLDSIVNNLPKGHHLILVTPYEGDKSKDTYTSVEQYAAYARELAEKNPYVSIADWNKVAKEHPEIWAGTDQVHFGNDNSKLEEGAKLYAETIAAAVKAAQELPVKSK